MLGLWGGTRWRGRRQVLDVRSDQAAQPRRVGHVHRVLPWAQGPPGRDPGHLAPGRGPAVYVHLVRSSLRCTAKKHWGPGLAGTARDLHRSHPRCRRGPFRRLRRRLAGPLPGDDHHLGTVLGRVRAVPRVTDRSEPSCTPRMKSSTVGGGSLGLPVGDEHFVVPFLLLGDCLLGVAYLLEAVVPRWPGVGLRCEVPPVARSSLRHFWALRLGRANSGAAASVFETLRRCWSVVPCSPAIQPECGQ
jgi:hypothetical protein